jgi:hypothetical protein
LGGGGGPVRRVALGRGWRVYMSRMYLWIEDELGSWGVVWGVLLIMLV